MDAMKKWMHDSGLLTAVRRPFFAEVGRARVIEPAREDTPRNPPTMGDVRNRISKREIDRQKTSEADAGGLTAGKRVGDGTGA
jgi:hypothetical protein